MAAPAPRWPSARPTSPTARVKATRLLAAAALRDVGARLAVAKDVIGKPELSRQELAAVLRVASSLTRDLAVVHAGADRRTLANGDAAEAVDRLAAQLPAAVARKAFATIDRGLSAARAQRRHQARRRVGRRRALTVAVAGLLS